MKTSKPHLVEVVKRKQIEVFANGVIAHPQQSRWVDISGLQGHKRKSGDITCFSASSCRRLRHWLVSMDVPGATRFGLTVTLPADDCWAFRPDSFVGPVRPLLSGRSLFPASGFNDTIDRFGKNLRRSLPPLSLVWRAELQTRGAPHLHGVLFMDDGEKWIETNGLCPEEIAAARHLSLDEEKRFMRFFRRWSCFSLHGVVTKAWVNAVLATCFVGNKDGLESFIEGRGVDVEPLVSSPAYMRYVSDHMSKHKREQLGYEGRQWGIIGRSRFESVPIDCIEDRRACALLSRILGKIRRFKISREGCPFGWYHSRYRPADTGVVFTGNETLSRLNSFIQGESRNRVFSTKSEGEAQLSEKILQESKESND